MSVISCPISPDRVDERVVRAVALQVTSLSIVYFFFPHWSIPLFLSADFLVRATNNRKWSLLRLFGKLIKGLFGPFEKPINYSPKRFAATLGAVMSVLLLGVNLLGWDLGAYAIAGIFLVLSTLEWALAVCVGCHIYSFINHPLFGEGATEGEVG